MISLVIIFQKCIYMSSILSNQTISSLPLEIRQKIYNYYLDVYRFKMNWNQIHQELTEKEQYLIMSEHLFDFSVDYHFITRIPALESCWSDDEIDYII